MIIRSHIRLTMITDTIVHSIRTCAIVSFMIAMAVAFFLHSIVAYNGYLSLWLL